MLFLGRGNQRTCQGVTRREFVQIGASTVLGLSLADLLRLRADNESPTGTTRAVILLWLWGGPAQLDTWDPKPDAPLEFRGPFAAIPTRTPGVRFGELFPKIARLTPKLAVLRSLHTLSNDHGVAGTVGLTGSNAGGTGLDGKPLPGAPRPTTGSIVARVRGATSAPPFMVIGGRLHQGKKAIVGEGGGTLGGLYDPFRLEHDPIRGTRFPALQLP